MSAQNQPTWMARRRWRDPEPTIDTSRAKRVQPTTIRIARVILSGKRYASYSVHELLEHESESDRARPGHPFG
jgi:hypothetical protein